MNSCFANSWEDFADEKELHFRSRLRSQLDGQKTVKRMPPQSDETAHEAQIYLNLLCHRAKFFQPMPDLREFSHPAKSQRL